MKNLDWSKLTSDILRILKMNQVALAAECKVTQQTVSCWKTDSRSPGVYTRNKLRDLAAEAKLNFKRYKVNNLPKPAYQKELPEDVLAFAQVLSVLPKKRKLLN